MNSAEDKPNQIMLNALPLDFVKYLEMVVEAVSVSYTHLTLPTNREV